MFDAERARTIDYTHQDLFALHAAGRAAYEVYAWHNDRGQRLPNDNENRLALQNGRTRRLVEPNGRNNLDRWDQMALIRISRGSSQGRSHQRGGRSKKKKRKKKTRRVPLTFGSDLSAVIL